MSKIEKKIMPEFFERIMDGSKRFEVRLADFDCKEGDILILKEWDPESGNYTGRSVEKKVTYVYRTKDHVHWSDEDIEKHGLQIIGIG